MVLFALEGHTITSRPWDVTRIALPLPAYFGRMFAISLKSGLEMSERPTVLFSCVHNSGRSVVAAGLLRVLAGEGITALSRGSEPGTKTDPQIVAVMAEVGIDVTDHVPTQLVYDDVAVSDVVVTMACGEACPYVPGKRYEDWPVDDPKGQDLHTVRLIRDDIRVRVEALMAELLPDG